MKRNGTKYIIVIIICLMLVIFNIKHILIINHTSSMKEGVYIKSSDQEIRRGSIIEFCLEDPYKTLALKRDYILPSSSCFGAEPLLKKVIAVPGDSIKVTSQNIEINGVLYDEPIYLFDHHNRKLNFYQTKKYNHISGYWVMGDHDKYSFDSRYFGPIESKQILYVVKALLVE